MFASHSFRVCYTFGTRIKFTIQDITPTFLSPGVISTLRQADHVAHSVIRNHGKETQKVKISFIIKSRQEDVYARFSRVTKCRRLNFDLKNSILTTYVVSLIGCYLRAKVQSKASANESRFSDFSRVTSSEWNF